MEVQLSTFAAASKEAQVSTNYPWTIQQEETHLGLMTLDDKCSLVSASVNSV